MSADPEWGELVEEVESEEVEVRVVDLGDAVVETRQAGWWFFTDSNMVPNSCG